MLFGGETIQYNPWSNEGGHAYCSACSYWPSLVAAWIVLYPARYAISMCNIAL
jgi:hypothetical protein